MGLKLGFVLRVRANYIINNSSESSERKLKVKGIMYNWVTIHDPQMDLQ